MYNEKWFQSLSRVMIFYFIIKIIEIKFEIVHTLATVINFEVMKIQFRCPQ